MDFLNPKDLQPQTMLGMKLIQQPFSKMPPAENLFDFDALKQTRDTVSHHLQFSHLLMIIQGSRGSGKDSLANSLIVSEHPALYFFNATVQSGDNVQLILNKAAKNNNAESIQQFESRIHDIMYRGQQPVLIINDAELIAETELHELIQYASSKKDSNQQIQLKLLLLGDLSLEKNLERYGIINHNQFYMIELPLLNVSNTRSFLMHRLTQAGYRDASPFTDKDITNIYNIANGNPAATMERAAGFLNHNKNIADEDFSAQTKTKKTLIIIAALLFIAAIIYNSILMSPETPPAHIISKPADTVDQTAIDRLFNPANNNMAVKQEKPANALPQLAVPELAIPPLDKATQTTDIKTPQESVQAPAEPSQPAAQTLLEIKTAAELAPADFGITHTEAEPGSEIKPALKTEVAVLSKPKIMPASQPVDKITQSFIKVGALPPDWLLKQAPEHWSLQILGGYQPESLLSFIRQHRLSNKVAYFPSHLNNKAWHVILYGQYKSKAQAKAAIARLPAYIRQQKPWPKDMKSVQNAIKQYKHN